MADMEEKARLLRILQGHGQSFLASFETPMPGESSKKRKAGQGEAISSKRSKRADIEELTNEGAEEGDEEEEEWLGSGHDRDEADFFFEGSSREGSDGSGEYLISW